MLILGLKLVAKPCLQHLTEFSARKVRCSGMKWRSSGVGEARNILYTSRRKAYGKQRDCYWFHEISWLERNNVSFIMQFSLLLPLPPFIVASSPYSLAKIDRGGTRVTQSAQPQPF